MEGGLEGRGVLKPDGTDELEKRGMKSDATSVSCAILVLFMWNLWAHATL